MDCLMKKSTKPDYLPSFGADTYVRSPAEVLYEFNDRFVTIKT